MIEWPKIMLGGPVRDRAWICGEWLIALLNQDYPPEKMRIVVLVNDSQDETREVCEWIRDRFGWMVSSFEVHEQNFGCKVDNTNRALRNRDMQQFARVRNAWIDLRRDEDYLWTVDSDIICQPSILPGLVANEKDLCAAVIMNNSEWHTNVLHWLKPERGPQGGFYWDTEASRKQELYQCDLTGACMLISRRVLDAGIRYAALEPEPGESNSWEGEDPPFCCEAQQAGFTLWADGRLRPDHRMHPPLYRGEKSAIFTSMFADLTQWRAQQVRARRFSQASKKEKILWQLQRD